MKKLTLLFVLLAAYGYAAPPAPYPFTVDSQAQTVPALQVYQAAARTFRVTFKDGTNASSLAGATPWMWWATGVTARSYYTSTCTVVSSPSGVSDFLFDSVALNWSGGVSGVYGVGVTDSNGHFAVSRQGTFVISASPFGAGVAMPQATSNINCDLYTWLNPPWQNYTNSGYTMAQADARFATGTPIYIETDEAGIAWAGTGITAAAVAQLWAGSNHTALGVETAARIGADTALSNLIAAIPGAVAVNTNNLIAGITNNAANITSEVARAVGAESALSNSVSTNVTALLAQITNKVAKTGDTMTGQLTITTNLSINAAGTQWYIGSAPDQFWLGNAQIADWSGGLVFDATNYDLKIDGAFIGSAAKLTSFPATLATLAALGAEITNRIGADTALSNGLAGVGAGATSLVSAAKTDASNQFVNVGGDTMTGPLVASNIYSVGAMTISADGVLTLNGGDGVVVNDPITFEEPLTGPGWGLSGIPISGVSGLSTALESKVSSVAILPTLTVADLSSVGTNLCTGFTTQTGTLGGVKITNIYANIAAGKTYAWGLGLQSTYLGTSWLTCANFSLTNSSPGTRVTNYFSMATSTDRVVLTISSVAGMAQIVTNVYVCEVRTGTVWVAGDAHVGGDIIAANYSHNMGLLTNAQNVSLGLSASSSSEGVGIGYAANGNGYGSAFGRTANGAYKGVAVGYVANGSYTGVSIGASSDGSIYGVAVGGGADGNSRGVSVGYGSDGSLSGVAVGYEAHGSVAIAIGPNANATVNGVAIGNAAKGLGGRIAIGNAVSNSIDNSAALRGTLYLDGGTGVYYRSTFGTGAWLPYGSGGADMTQAVHDVSAHATNYVPRTGGTMSGPVTNSVGYWMAGGDRFIGESLVFANDGYIKAGETTTMITFAPPSGATLHGNWGATDDFSITGTGRVNGVLNVDHTLSVSGAVTAASYDDGTNTLDVSGGTWNGQTIVGGSSADLTYLSNGVNSWLSSSGQLAVVTNDYPAGTLGVLATTDGGTTAYYKAEATAGAELDPIAGALGTNNANAILAMNAATTGTIAQAQATGVVAFAWASTGITASATAQATGVAAHVLAQMAVNTGAAAYVWAEAARTNAEGRILKPASPETGTVLYWNGSSWQYASNVYYLVTNWLFRWASTNSPARFPCDGE